MCAIIILLDNTSVLEQEKRDCIILLPQVVILMIEQGRMKNCTNLQICIYVFIGYCNHIFANIISI